MSNSHHHSTETSGIRLLVTIILNFIITIVEIIGGIISGSLSLISDALHNFSDGIALILSYIAIRLNRKPKDAHYTFGYKRAEILAAVFNASILIGISFYLFFEAYNRFTHPKNIEGGLMIIVASISLIANVTGTLLLKPGSKDNINIRSAYLHLLSDAVSSLGVIIGGILIFYFGIYLIDPILTVLISLYIIRESWFIVKEAITVLMMAAPSDISIKEIEKAITNLNGITNIHHIHVWKINENDVHFEAHIEVEDVLVSQTENKITEIEKLLHDKFEINHVTIQFESGRCSEKNLV